MERRIKRHSSRLSSQEGALDTQFKVGDRVRTIDGFIGRIIFVSESFSPGITEYQVVLDNGMGGGTYTASQLRPVPEDLGGGSQAPANLPAGVTARYLTEDEARAAAYGQMPDGVIGRNGQSLAEIIHTAADDYPEFGSVLHDRPDPAGQFTVIGSKIAHYDPEDPHDRDYPESHNNGWCDVCEEHHYSSEEAENHESAHTDWDEHYPQLPHVVHRGMSVELPAHVHEFVHDQARPVAERARALSDHLARGVVGNSWSSDPERGEHYAHVAEYDGGKTHVFLHAARPERHHIETDVDALEDRRVLGYDKHEDQEIPLRDNAPVSLIGISWRKGDRSFEHPGPLNEFRFPRPQQHTAAAYGTDQDPREPGESGGIYGQAPAQQQWLGENIDEPEEPLPPAGGPEPPAEGPPPPPPGDDEEDGEGPPEGEEEPPEDEDQDFAPHEAAWLWAATQMSGRPGTSMQQVDDHGDAPGHGSDPGNPRAAEPNSYDDESTEGQGDGKWDDAKAYDIHPSPGSSVPQAGPAEHRTEEEVKKNTNGAQIGMFPENVSGGGGPGLEIGGFVATLHEANVPWTGHERGKLHEWSTGQGANWGDFVPSTEYGQPQYVPEPEPLPDSQDVEFLQAMGSVDYDYREHLVDVHHWDPDELQDAMDQGLDPDDEHTQSHQGMGGWPAPMRHVHLEHMGPYRPHPETLRSTTSSEGERMEHQATSENQYWAHLQRHHHWGEQDIGQARAQGRTGESVHWGLHDAGTADHLHNRMSEVEYGRQERRQEFERSFGTSFPLRKLHPSLQDPGGRLPDDPYGSVMRSEEGRPHPLPEEGSLESRYRYSALQAEALVQRRRADQVYSQLAGDYPAKAIDWVHSVRWHGPEQTALSDINWAGRGKWAAYDQPERVAKVGKKNEKRAARGKDPKPAILTQVQGRPKDIGDGHHRGLRALVQGQPLDSYTAEVPDEKGPWAEMHSQQFGNDGTGRERGPDGTPEDRDRFHGEVEGAFSRLPGDEEPDNDLERGEPGPQADTEDEANSLDFGDPSATPSQPAAMTGLPPWTQGTSPPAGQQPVKPGRAFGKPGKDGKPDFSSGEPNYSGDKDGKPKEKADKKPKKESRLITAADDDDDDQAGQEEIDGPEYEAGPVRYHLGHASDWAEPGDLPGHLERKHGHPPEWTEPMGGPARVHKFLHHPDAEVRPDHDHHAFGREYTPYGGGEAESYGHPDTEGGFNQNRPITDYDPPRRFHRYQDMHEIMRETQPWDPQVDDEAHQRYDSGHLSMIIEADQANAPWGSQAEPSHPPAKPFGATEPRAPDTNPADHGFLNAPDPENWGEIDETSAAQMPLSNMASLDWDEVGARHPHVYGDPEEHGEEAEGADGEGIGSAANDLANDRPEDPGAEGSSAWDLSFHHEKVHPRHIDYARHERGDPRVRQAYEGYMHGDKVPPVVLVHRHGIYQVADGHHRAQGAARAGKKVSAYVHYSEHEDTPFSDGTRGPFHGAEPHPGIRHEAALAGPDIDDWGPEYQESFPYSDQSNTAGPSTSISPADPQGIRMEESRVRAALRRALAELHDEPEAALDPEGVTADGGYALDASDTGGGPGMSMHDEDMSPDDTSIQTIGNQQWSGGGADSDEVSVPAGMPSGDEYGGTEGTGQKEDDIIARFQASAAAQSLNAGNATPQDNDIAAAARGYLSKTAEVFGDAEAGQLIAEGRGVRARNLDLLDISGTHYEDLADELNKRGSDDLEDDVVWA
jgi:hypothetical protein